MSEEKSSANYMVVARRYRPQSFQDVIGQEHVETALTNAITSGRVGHAYLFTGARGVGKTSTARIFAKALNCVNGPTTTPCGECESCKGITAGDDADVLEIDGASNRGIDEIRTLRQGTNIRPTRSRYKIYIIDEVHMLTREAFNALLKTLEEPPAHVKFIFCTTEPTKIPITILSRCQRYDFAGISTDRIAQRLTNIAQSEGVTCEQDAIDLLARRAAGSMRDGQSLLEQLLAFAPDHIKLADVHQVLGTTDEEFLLGILKNLSQKNIIEALDAFNEAMGQGRDPAIFLEQLCGVFRDLMVLEAGGTRASFQNISPDNEPVLKEASERMGLQSVLAALQIIDHCLDRMRFTTLGRTLCELALTRIGSLGELDNISRILVQLGSGGLKASTGSSSGSGSGSGSNPALGQASYPPQRQQIPAQPQPAQPGPGPAYGQNQAYGNAPAYGQNPAYGANQPPAQTGYPTNRPMAPRPGMNTGGMGPNGGNTGPANSGQRPLGGGLLPRFQTMCQNQGQGPNMGAPGPQSGPGNRGYAARPGIRPQQGYQGYPQQGPNGTYPGMNQGHPQQGPNGAYPGMNQGYPQQGPNGAYPGMNQGYPQQGPNGAYPGMNQSYPQQGPNGAYPGMNQGYPQQGPNGPYPGMNQGYPQQGPNAPYSTGAPTANSRQSNWGQAPHAATSPPTQPGYPGANQLPGSTPFPRNANGPVDSDPLPLPLPLPGATVGAPRPNDDFDPVSGSVSSVPSTDDDFGPSDFSQVASQPNFNANSGNQEVPPVPFARTPQENSTLQPSRPDNRSNEPVALPQPLTPQNATDTFVDSCSFLSGLKLQNAKSFESVKCLAPNAIEITYTQRFALGYNFWQRPENLSQLRDALRAICGGPVEVHFQLINDPVQTRGSGPTKAEASFQMKRQIYQNPLVQDAINLFQSDVKAVYDEPFPTPISVKEPENDDSLAASCIEPDGAPADMEND